MGDGLPHIEFTSLIAEHDCSGFDCANKEITQWVRKKAIKDHRPGAMHVTCAIPKGGSRPIGIYALSTVAEEVANLPGQNYRLFRSGKHFPALHLVWLATDKGFANQGLGKLMVGKVITIFADIGTRVGIPHLILTPAEQDKDRLTSFYESLGFETYNDDASMFLSIETARTVVDQMKHAV